MGRAAACGAVTWFAVLRNFELTNDPSVGKNRWGRFFCLTASPASRGPAGRWRLRLLADRRKHRPGPPRGDLARQYAGHAAQFKKPAPKTAIGPAQPRRRLVRRVGGLRTVGLARPLATGPQAPAGSRSTSFRRPRQRLAPASISSASACARCAATPLLCETYQFCKKLLDVENQRVTACETHL
jgi:hypothetical protein